MVNSRRNPRSMMRVIIFILPTILILSSCGKRYTTCDCADLTYELYQDYDEIVFSDKSLIRKAVEMRRAKKALKKDIRYKYCREQGVRPLSVVFYPKNRKIFASCTSWKAMESDLDQLWKKLKDKIGIDDEEEE